MLVLLGVVAAEIRLSLNAVNNDTHGPVKADVAELPVELIPTKVLSMQVIAQTDPVLVTDEVEKVGTLSYKGKLGIVVNDYANARGELSSLENLLGKGFSTVSIFKQFGSQFNSELIIQDLQYIKNSGKNLLIAWEPWNPDEGMSQNRDYLAVIIRGEVDVYINRFAGQVKEYGNPVVIRFGHEMNGDWYPWGRRPDEYKLAYQRIVEVFGNAGVDNVKWMWSVNAEPVGGLASYYPGDGYVDVIGIDGFNWGTAAGRNSWRSFAEVFKPAYDYLINRYEKPLIISETASSEIGGDKPAWIQMMWEVLPLQFSKVSEVIWFNLLKEADWRLESSDTSLAAYKKVLGL